jgi:hydrophobic/amphiphilic exporter-1 (mainly G- bacteria), HAE1 family
VIRGAIGRPIAISMLFMALMLIGGLSYKRLPVDLLPSIDYPRLTVITNYDDVPPGELERLVTQPLEEVITALSGVRSVQSRTREGISAITVEYEWGTEMDFANLHLREAVDRVAYRDAFPEEAERPLLLRWDPTGRPVSVLVLEGDGRLEQLSDFAREVVKPALEQVDGLSQAEVVGAADREVIVEPDPDKLALYGIGLEEIRSALARSNISFPGGQVRQGPLTLSLRIAGEFENLQEIRQTDILRLGDSTVRVEDVARVYEGVKDPEGVTLLGGDQVVSILIYKEPDANTLQVAAEVDRALAVLESSYQDLAYRFVTRDADFVRASFLGLAQSLLLGAALAFLVLFMFLSDFRSPFVVGLSIPVSIMITFALLYFGKVKLNLMSLGGLSLAAGMLVDNAIVVLENIRRHLDLSGDAHRDTNRDQPGLERRRQVAAAAAKGSSEMARPVIAATLTTIAVFFPVIYVPGIAGAFFRDQALTVTFSLLVSIASALLLQPTLSARLLVARKRAPRGLFRLFQTGLDRFHDAYHRLLERFLRHPAPALLLLLVGLAATGWWGFDLDRSFMPASSAGDISLELELSAGTSLEECRSFCEQLGWWLEEDPAVEGVFSQVGRTESTLASLKEYTAAHTARLRIVLAPGLDFQDEYQRLQARVIERIAPVPGIRSSFREESVGLSEILGSDGAPFRLGVIAEDATLAAAAAEDLMLALNELGGLTDLKVDRVLGTPNLVASIDREEVLRRGLSTEQVSRELRDRIGGVVATTFNEVDQRIDIAIRLPRERRQNLDEAMNASIDLPGGGSIPLGSLLSLEEERPLRELLRNNQRRMVTLSAELTGERALDEIWHELHAMTAEMNLPEGIQLIEAGEQAAMQRSFRDLGWAMILAVLLVYMILAAQFESFLDPLLIAAVLPIGLAGSIIAIGVTGNTVNILSMIGVLALLGIAVNDAIVKVDTIRRLRSEGMAGMAAIMQASSLRLRPILMTSVTTVLAMLPMAIGLGSGEQLQRPLAVTIIGGLSLTTALTLFYTPLLYMLGHKLRREAGGAR